MPKGVEHYWDPKRLCQLSNVPNSVMPKGVEHYWDPKSLCELSNVPNSVMPKGVEHTRGSSAFLLAVFVCRIQ